MIHRKSPQEIEIMKQGGQILKSTLSKLLQMAKPGTSLTEIDQKADEIIKKAGAEASFNKVPNYHWATCLCVNDVVVHGIPTNYKLRQGDIIGIDCGIFYKGFHTDSAWTVLVGNKEDTKHTGGVQHTPGVKEPEIISKKRFLETGKRALKNALSQIKPGNRIGHISQAIQDTIKSHGYSVVKSLTGHGIGKNLHEKPEIPGLLRGKIEDTPKIIPGMVLAVEVIYNMGSPDVIYKNSDGWTIATKDAKISGLFESTVAIEDDGVFLLT